MRLLVESQDCCDHQQEQASVLHPAWRALQGDVSSILSTSKDEVLWCDEVLCSQWDITMLSEDQFPPESSLVHVLVLTGPQITNLMHAPKMLNPQTWKKPDPVCSSQEEGTLRNCSMMRRGVVRSHVMELSNVCKAFIYPPQWKCSVETLTYSHGHWRENAELLFSLDIFHEIFCVSVFWPRDKDVDC